MNNLTTNNLTSFTATINIADSEEFTPIWTGQSPEHFGEGVAVVRGMLKSTASKAANQSASTTGDAEALRNLHTDLEEWPHVLGRAAFQALTVLDLAEPLSVAPQGGGDPPRKKSSVTAALVAKVDDLWTQFATAVGTPAGSRAKRKALTGQLPNDVRGSEAKFAGLDDVVIQFGESATGSAFVDAWFNARKVVDLGRRAAKPATEPAPAAK